MNIFQNNVEEYPSGQDDPFQTITEAMDHPTDVTVDKKGMLYVSNGGNSTVVDLRRGRSRRLSGTSAKAYTSPYGIASYPPLLP